MYLMIDFETLGSAADTVCVSVGLVAFNKTGVIGKPKLIKFDLHDQIKRGRSITAGTVEWWMRQSDQARAVFQPADDKLLITDFFKSFESFVDQALAKVGEGRDQLKPVGNGANFDVSILEHLYRSAHPQHEHAIPWRFWNVFCFRTFNTLVDCKRLVARPHGTHHTADEDALYQANCMIAYWKKQAARKAAK